MPEVELDLDDTSRCPVAKSCASCGGGDELEVVTISAPVGLFCVTLCRSCIRHGETFGDAPRFTAATAVRRSLAHCEHLGITSDQMGEAMQREARE